MATVSTHVSEVFDRVRVLAKVRDILDAFTLERPELELREIRKATGMPTTTCLRLLRNLVNDGVLSQDGRGYYRIGLAVQRWAAVARQGLGIVEIASPSVQRLRDVTGETAGLFVRHEMFRVCIALAETRRALGRRLYVGHIVPVHAGSPGKVLLAFDDRARAEIRSHRLEALTARTLVSHDELEEELDRVRSQGYATSLGEWDLEVSGVAAPIFGADARIAAAVAISAPAQRLGSGVLTAAVAAVRDAARDITLRLGGSHPAGSHGSAP